LAFRPQGITEEISQPGDGPATCLPPATTAASMRSRRWAGSITRAVVDGGRDAIGTYRLGPTSDRISLDFALEAKCYAPGSGVGVEGLSRLISRLRYREFGILVTTSFLGRQAYEELRSNRHPVIVIQARTSRRFC
jgi:hypothetical protein